MPRRGAERVGEHRGRDRSGQCRGDGRDRLARSGKTAPRGDEHHREGVARQEPACAATWSRFTRAGCITSTVYRKYTDVRLVFAPSRNIAFFGGDPDNFEYPATISTSVFFRVYEDGKPAKAPHYLKVEPGGAQDGRFWCSWPDIRARPTG